ncbi:MAG: trigger factor [Bacteroidota bacterium]
MDISLDKKSNTEALIKVKLNESDYQPRVDEKVKDYAKKANIKGFRPGKVPTGLIKKMYGKSILVEEINSLLSKSVTDYIRENDIKIVGEPIPDLEKSKSIDWDTQKEFEFDYDIGFVEDFTYDLSKKVKVKHYKIEADQKVMDKTLDSIKKQFGEVTNPEASEADDSLFGKVKATDSEDEGKDALIPIDKVEKKEQKKFIGAKAGDVVKFEISKALKDEQLITHIADVDAEAAKDLKGEYQITVDKINRTVPAEINEELFEKVFGKDSVKTEDEFMAKVKETIEENYQRESDYFLDINIRDQFIENTKLEIPETFLKKWIQVSNEGKVSEEQIEKEFEAYTKELKWTFITNKISEDNEIKVEHPDVVDKAKEMILQQFGGPAMAAQLGDQLDGFANNYLQGENGDNYMRVFNQVRGEKVSQFIKEQITLNEKSVSMEEFEKIVQK